MKKFQNKIDFIFENKLYSLKNKKEIFFKLMLNLTKFHFSSCKSYKKILDGFKYIVSILEFRKNKQI